ncbi:aminoglycoside 6'-N-acetyltransferase [Sphingomonas sp.]|uniref:aminoglycoside 6'-N-acetyltransferase n=1 Tax=Sphingomonas sp. TaxID=28214 RepID=UPI001B073453|nr:aminoglycoside 6'-N-acetyltransferase [Sphingomonas sp.]MBO9711935.1 GNAT family N-acetyltransferase [Sphingomonas sp.]
MDIAPATPADLDDWARMRHALWGDEASAEDLRDEAAEALGAPDTLVLIARAADGSAAGFAEAAIRRDYVNGCDTSPVAFLEGIHVEPAHRRQGLASALVDGVAVWGRAQGCIEFASDALVEDVESHRFHAAAGFEETERVVYFRKAL